MSVDLDVRVAPDAETAAREVSDLLCALLREAANGREVVSVAFSKATTPRPWLADLTAQGLPWEKIHVFQVDERVVPDGDPARNLTHLRASLLDRVPIPVENVHVMDVTAADRTAAAAAYDHEIREVTGGELDIVHLGLGDDGHTASLGPGNPALDEDERLVTTVDERFHDFFRMTLTFPALDSARHRVWLVTGGRKAPVLTRLIGGDETIPAGRVRRAGATLVCDRAAMGGGAGG